MGRESMELRKSIFTVLGTLRTLVNGLPVFLGCQRHKASWDTSSVCFFFSKVILTGHWRCLTTYRLVDYPCHMRLIWFYYTCCFESMNMRSLVTSTNRFNPA